MNNIPQEKVTEINGIKLHTIETKKYKTNSIVLKMKAPLENEFVTTRALLPYVLQSGTKKLPSALQIRSYLDELYGASLFVDVSKKGEYQILTFKIDIANEKYLSNAEPLLEKGLSLLADLILSPALENESFPSSTVEKEKRSLKQRIESVYDDKMRYANMRLLEEMFKTEPYRLHVHGQKEDLDSITERSLYDYYQKCILEDEIDLFIVGDIDSKSVGESISNSFVFPKDRNTKFTEAKETTKEIVKENEVIEEQDIKQGKLHIGYRTSVTYSDKDYFALQLFNGIFGGFSHSKLFINVREKASLAYYAASRFESHKGFLMVMSGIENKNYKQAVEIIKEQMEHMKNGNFDENELNQTKSVIKNQVLETIDTSQGLIEILYHNAVSTVQRPLEEWFTKIDEQSKEDIIAVGQKVELDTIYFLKGLESA